jgi:hypothetical protein
VCQDSTVPPHKNGSQMIGMEIVSENGKGVNGSQCLLQTWAQKVASELMHSLTY